LEKLKEKKSQEALGDGKAVFLELGTDEEYEEYVMKEDRGWGGFIKKIFNPEKNETNNEQTASESGDPAGERGGDAERESGNDGGGATHGA